MSTYLVGNVFPAYLGQDWKSAATDSNQPPRELALAAFERKQKE